MNRYKELEEYIQEYRNKKNEKGIVWLITKMVC